MSLLGSIQMAGNTLRANEIGLQVVGQNIANANTPGYIREELVLTPAPTQKYGGLLLGMGVSVDAVIQKIDKFLEERLRGAVSDEANSKTQQETYAQLEGLLGALDDTSLSASMNSFFSSISEILNQPEDASVRNLAMLQGDSLAQNINRLATRTGQVRADINSRIQNMAGDINRLTEEIRGLNVQIANAEGGNISKSDAVGLRDQRNQALEDLAKLIDIRTVEQPSGTVTVYNGGDYLVYEGMAQQVNVKLTKDRGLSVAGIQIASTDSPLNPAAGELRGLLTSRDDILGGFLDKLDTFAGTLAFEFNKVYSGGQGLNGFNQMTSQAAVDDSGAALNNAGLKFTPENGSFQLLVHDKKTGLTETTDIQIDLSGMGRDTTLDDLKDALAQIDGISATVTTDGRLVIASNAQDEEFAFANDTSGVLAALGLNTFFTGSNARDLAVNADVRNDPAKFAASRGGISKDTVNAVDLAQFLDRPLAAQDGASIGVLYNRMAGEMTQGSTVAKAVATGDATFETTLRGQKLATSGVNVDEEAINMLGYQRSYQAAAKYISTLNDLLAILVQL
jgi:flagellar hook-associated protein 1